jgi:hypothetical protein
MLRAVSLLVLCLPAFAPAQQAKVDVKKITIHPTSEPVPALRYRLLPEVRDLRPGNAAMMYLRAQTPEFYSSIPGSALDKFDFDVPLDKLNVTEVDKALAHRGMLTAIDLAARRAYCDWELIEPLRVHGIGLLLPEVQGLRMFARLTSLRARRALIDRDYDRAVHSLQSGFALGRHAAEGPTLINYLVGIAITAIQAEVVREWITLPDSPNLYWSLTALPRPLVPIEKNFEGERLFMDSMFPGVRDALRDPTAPLPSVEQIREGAKAMKLAEPYVTATFLDDLLANKEVLERARKYLESRGRTAAQIQALQPAQLVAMYQVAQYDRYYDEILKVIGLPRFQAAAAIARTEASLKKAKNEKDMGAVLATLLVPAVDKVLQSQARIEQRLAGLRVIEAIRLHAHETKKLPEKLDDITIVPVPVDPINGKAFPYRVEAGTAILELSGTYANRIDAVRYEISLATK